MPTLTDLIARRDAYYIAELEILKAQELRNNDKFYRMPELQAVQKMIGALDLQIARKQASDAGQGLRFSVANLNRGQ